MRAAGGDVEAELGVLDAGSAASASVDDVFRFIGRRWKTIIGFGLAGAALSALAVANMQPRYVSETLIALNTEELRVLDVADVVDEAQVDNAVVRTEMDKLTSQQLLETVARQLALFDDPEFARPDDGGGRLMTRLRALIGDAPEAPDPEDLAQRAEERALLGRAAIVGAVRSRLNVSANYNSYVIKLTFTSRDAAKSARIANAIVTTFLAQQKADREAASAGANSFLDERLNDLREELRVAEAAVQAYRARFNLASVDGGTVAERQMVEISTALSVARAERLQAEARLEGVRDGVRRDGGAGSLVSPLMDTLREQEVLVQRQIAELSNRYGPRHPRIVTLQAELSQIRAKMTQEANTILRSLETEVQVAAAREKSLQDALAGLEGDVAKTRSAELRMRELEREAEATRQIFESFLERYETVVERPEIEDPAARQIAPAELSTRQTWPRPLLMVGGGTVFFLLLGVLLAVVIEALDSGFQTVRAISRATGLPTLSVVSEMPGRAKGRLDLHVLREPFSAVAEGLRAVVTSVVHASDREVKVIGFVSSLPREGKTTTSRAIARLNATAGRRVLLLDCDFRRAAARKEQRAGISELLTLPGTTLREVIIPDPETGMHYLPPGKLHINPPTLLGSERMRRLLEATRRHYDLILVDLPAVLPVADAFALARQIDAFVYLVQWRKTPRAAVTDGLRRLRLAGANISGVVLTRVDISRFASYGYGGGAAYYSGYAEYAKVQAAQ